jgi:hypothetical protein
MKYLVIVNDILDLDNVNKNFDELNFEIITKDFTTFLNGKKHGLRYLYEDYSFEEINETFNEFAFCSFRDEQGKDYTEIDDISISHIMSRRMIMAANEDLRNFIVIEKELRKFDKIFIPDNCEQSFKRLSKHFKDKFHFYKNAVKYKSTPNHNRTVHRPFPITYFVLKFYRFFQKSISMFLKNKHIVLNDDFYFNVINNKRMILTQNNINLFKGFCFIENKELIDTTYKKIKVLNFEFSQIFDNALKVKERLCLNLPDDFIKYYCELFIEEFEIQKEVLLRTYLIWIDLITFYQPLSVTFPGETHYAYILLASMCKKQKIHTRLMIDGIQTDYNPSNFLYLNEKNPIFNEYIAYGSAHAKLAIAHGFLKENVKIAMNPMISKKYSNKKMDFEAIILTYAPRINNTSCLADKGYKIIVDIILALRSVGIKRILIKLKPGGGEENVEIENIKNFIKIYEIDSNDLLFSSGKLIEKLRSNILVIGQFSTAIIETEIKGAHYFVFEPEENGLTTYQLEKSCFFTKRHLISRNINELMWNLKERVKSCDVPILDLLYGEEIDRIITRKIYGES